MMFSAVVIAVLMVVVITVNIGIKAQPTADERVYSIIRAALHTAVKLNACLLERLLCAAADAAADERIHMGIFEKARQRAVAAAHGGKDYFGDDGIVLHVIKGEVSRVTKMLKDISIFISDCNSHG